ncbi:TerD family protein, partial [Chromatium okenii]|uniref:TerD family protein n=1 Tax=Chromatium okenii TaxID=61644 RepID=UPI0026EC5B45
MSIELQQGANTAILERNLMISIGWNKESAIEADVSAFLINSSGTVRDDQDFIFYNQTQTVCGGLVLDPEYHRERRLFRAFLDRIPDTVNKLVFIITVAIDSDIALQPHCGQLGMVYIDISDQSNQQLLRFNLQPSGEERALMLGELYRHQGTWKFRAVGQGYNGGLDILAASFGVSIQNPVANSHIDHAIAASSTLPSKQVWTEKATELQRALRQFLPQIKAAVANGANESNTRMILDRILLDV